MRFSLALLISINIHVWMFTAGSLLRLRSKTVEKLHAVEVEMIQLPALPEPGKGGEIIKRADHLKRPGPTGPIVKYRVTISSSNAVDSGPLHFEESESPERKFPKKSSLKDTEQSEFRPRLEKNSFDSEKTADSSDLDPGGDPRPLVKIIQARIDEVTPLIHHTSDQCRFEQGIIKIRFRISRHGYTESKTVYGSSGPACLQKVAEKILHMAEPYPYVAGWVPVTIRFTL